jgi:HlyD family secretion protein
MTANLTITIDERNNVLKVPNAALRFTPTDASGQRIGRTGAAVNSTGQDSAGQRSGQRSQPGQQQPDNANAAGASQSGAGAQGGGQQGSQQGQRNFAPPSAPVLEGQTRVIWVLGQDGKLQSRRIKVGLSDGASTEVVEGNLTEGEMVVTGQTLTSATKTPSTNAAPGFGGGQRTGAPGGGGRRN